MRKADVAECILSLTTTRERAVSTAGDLAEECSSRGTLWFWGSLLRTTASLVWRAFEEEPLRLTGLAVRGFFVQFLYLFAAFLCAAVAILLLIALSVRSPHNFLPSDLVGSVETQLAILASSFLVGKWLARKAPQRELAVYAMSWVVFLPLWIVALLTWPSLRVTVSGGEMILTAMTNIAGMIYMFAGIERVRKQSETARITSPR